MRSLLSNFTLKVILVFFVSRFVTGFTFQFYNFVDTGEFIGFFSALLEFLPKYDSGWYRAIAESGYQIGNLTGRYQATYAFYPLYPLLLRFTGGLFAWETFEAGLLLSHLFFLGYLLFFAKLCDQLKLSETEKTAALLLTAFCPNNFIFSSVYTESLFLFFTTGSMLLYYRKSYWSSGALAALSTASRSNGVFLFFFYGLDLALELGKIDRWNIGKFLRRIWTEPERLLPFFLAPLGLFLYWWFCFVETGDAFAQKSTLVAGWFWHFRFAPLNLLDILATDDFGAIFPVLIASCFFLCSFTLLHYKQYGLFGYCLVSFFVFLSTTNPASAIRYSASLFPIYIGLGKAVGTRTLSLCLCLLVFSILNALVSYGWFRVNWISA